MTEAEIRKLIREILRKELAQTMLATMAGTQNSYTSSMQRFSTDATISGLRMVFPYGFVSRPPQGTQCIVDAINSDPTHLYIPGQFDQGNRPTLEDSESAVYGPMGQMIYLDADGAITFTSYNTENGTILSTSLGKISFDGSINFTNTSGAFMTLDPSGEASLGNEAGSFSIADSGMASVDGGGGASHGIGLGDVIESRLAALEQALEILTSVFGAAHTHEVISLGSPTGPPVPIADPFVAVPTPAASVTAMVST